MDASFTTIFKVDVGGCSNLADLRSICFIDVAAEDLCDLYRRVLRSISRPVLFLNTLQ